MPYWLRCIAAVFLLIANSTAAAAGRIDTGDGYACGLDAQDYLWCWGYNYLGRLGINSGERSVATPNKVAGILGMRKIRAFSAGDSHACAVDSTGTAWCWGYNSNGQLAQPWNVNHSPTPLAVDMTALGAAKFASVSVGKTHSCALDTQGNAWCWGYGLYGKLGNGTTDDRYEPTPVSMPAGRSFQRIAAAESFTCALDQLGRVWCWGANNAGQLGSSGGDALVPRAVAFGSGTKLSELWANEEGACALDYGGKLLCWGDEGPVGLAAPAMPYPPVEVSLQPVPADRRVVGLDWSARHACLLDSTGQTWCWGYDDNGQLGDGPALARQDLPSPVALAEGSAHFEWISTGEYFTCAIDSAGHTYCWGQNSFGQMGVGFQDRTPTASAVAVQGAQEITSGYAHSCVLTTSAGVACWGSNQYGELGSGGAVADYATPQWVDAAGLGSATFTLVSAGYAHTCAIDSEHRGWCWGYQELYGALGSQGLSARTPRLVDSSKFPAGGLKTLDSGSHHTCAIDANDDAWCWGSNDYGQLGDGTQTRRNLPVKVNASGVKFLRIAAGRSHTCAIGKSNKSLYCWGYGQAIGFLDAQDRSVPTILPYVGNQDFSRVDAGGAHTCAAQDIPGNSSSSELLCFGDNSFGQLGTGQSGDSLQPVGIGEISGSGMGANMPQFSLGEVHSCMRSTFFAFAGCWGYNASGELADGSFESRDSPAVADFGQVSRVASGYDFSCAIRLDGSVACAGSQTRGQVGDGVLANPTVPQLNSFLSKATKIFKDSYEALP